MDRARRGHCTASALQDGPVRLARPVEISQNARWDQMNTVEDRSRVSGGTERPIAPGPDVTVLASYRKRLADELQWVEAELQRVLFETEPSRPVFRKGRE